MAAYAETRRAHLAAARAAVPAHQARLRWTREEIAAEQQRALRSLVRHAAAESPFYRERLAGVDPDRLTVDDLPALPPTTKDELMSSWDDVVTEPVLRRDELERFVASQTEFGYYADRYQVFESGGSSGVRGLYVWDWDFFVTTTNLAFRYEIRDSAGCLGSRRLLRAVVTSGVPPHAATPLFSADLDPPMETIVFPVSRPLAETVAAMNDAQPSHLVGYSSVIGDLAAEAAAGRLRIAPLRVATNSEPLLAETRTLVRRVWGVPVNNGWGSTELGMHAAECDFEKGLHLHEDALIVERVDDEDRPVPDDRPAAKVLMTSLVDRTFPFIRYELDDVVALADEPCPCGSAYRVVAEVTGRSLDAFVYGAVKVAPVVFARPLATDARIAEYQVRQTVDGADVDLVGDAGIDCDALAAAMEAGLAQAGVRKGRVRVRRVASLERNPVTGKLKRYVRL